VCGGKIRGEGGTLTVTGNLHATGSITATGSCCASDARVKENVKPVSPKDMLAVAKRLRPVTFDWKPDYIHSEGVDSYAARNPRNLMGFIAQEVEPLLPQAVAKYNTSVAPDFRTFNKAELLPVVVGAVQQLDNNVESLKIRAETAEMHLEVLENRLRVMERFIQKAFKKKKKRKM
jgi:hypothetical protein